MQGRTEWNHHLATAGESAGSEELMVQLMTSSSYAMCNTRDNRDGLKDFFVGVHGTGLRTYLYTGFISDCYFL